MKIDTSTINLSSAREFSKNTQVNIEQETRFIDLMDQNLGETMAVSPSAPTRLSLENPWYNVTSAGEQKTVEFSELFMGELKKLRQIMEVICERLNSICVKGGGIQTASLDQVNINPNSLPSEAFMEYEYTEKTTYSHYEKEATDFFADGKVLTADGRNIDFSFQLNLDREFFKTEQFVHQEKGYVFIDPLVINYDGTAPQLSEAYMSFDMNQDGEQEDIIIPEIGSGFLCLDKNNDGIINDGGELFGPSTGAGFIELSAYDLDQNSWIDENDTIFNELAIWENDEDGQMQLTRLADVGIGAIYLDSVATQFDMRDKDNQTQARIKRSGIALNEDGSVSSIQEMDWTV